MTDTLHTKYRPTTFKEVIGQEHFLKQLAVIVADRTSHAFLFHGPSGCGKTTLARICAAKLGCNAAEVREIDGATHNGIDNIRALQDAVRYKPLTGGDACAVIIDEAQRITANAFDALLKVLEEPPPHLFWFLCTTEPGKVPNTVRNRCQQFVVRSVQPDALAALLATVAKAEGLNVPTNVLQYIAGKSLGSPRRALVNLERCASCTTIKEAAVVLEQVVDEDTVLELCRFLCQFNKSRSWTKAMDLVSRIGDSNNAEGVRVIVVHYIAACLKGAKSDEEAVEYLKLLDPFSQPLVTREGNAGLILAIGRALLTAD